jgi:hypothetical protein
MRSLSLVGCDKVTDVTMLKIAECCPFIKYLNILSCANITTVGKDKIKEKCLSCTLVGVDLCFRNKI